MDPINHDFKLQVLSALTGSPIVQCCPCQDPDCPLSPMTVSHKDTLSVATCNSLKSTGVAIRDEVNKNGIAVNKYLIIKPPLLRTLHECNVYKMKLPQRMNKAKNCYPFQEIIKIVNNRKYCPEL